MSSPSAGSIIAAIEGHSEEEESPLAGRKRRELSNENARRWAEQRPWPVRALTVLLGLQALVVMVFALAGLRPWSTFQELLAEPETAFFLPLPALALLGLVATLGFLWMRPGSWVIAMLTQGLHLVVALVFYFLYGQEQYYLFGMMLFAIVMVLYLNYAEVPGIFRAYPDEVEEDV